MTGELDMCNVGALHARLSEAFADAVPPAPAVVDLREVAFLGAAGLDELLTRHEQAQSQRTPLRIVATQRCVLHLFEVAGLSRVFDLYADVARACAGDQPPPEALRLWR